VRGTAGVTTLNRTTRRGPAARRQRPLSAPSSPGRAPPRCRAAGAAVGGGRQRRLPPRRAAASESGRTPRLRQPPGRSSPCWPERSCSRPVQTSPTRRDHSRPATTGQVKPRLHRRGPPAGAVPMALQGFIVGAVPDPLEDARALLVPRPLPPPVPGQGPGCALRHPACLPVSQVLYLGLLSTLVLAQGKWFLGDSPQPSSC